ncbi:hypothetical protein HZR23_14820 [Serpentinicella alkaliphila]|uniref:hypothetical protein n=1 Tax=Serpentinicella alkaliphila TaxID=1734049 RepID=UPI0014053D9D|nr:hypothetical protein [Serpentinicella alkaliphila]QUH26870.1 hypothetical protein HZR23_14820 [Serpentinicella alkaliphila]
MPESIDDPKEVFTTLALEIRRVLLKTRDAVEILAHSIPSINSIKFFIGALIIWGF